MNEFNQDLLRLDKNQSVSDMNHLISLKNIKKTYQVNQVAFNVLKGITFNVSQGELLAIVGSSGSGKSTLMSIIGLLDKPSEGDYLLDNQNVATLNENQFAELRNKKIGFVFQQFNLLPRFTVKHNVALPLIYRHLKSAEIESRVSSALKRVGMFDFAERRPTQLSGGQQQRIAIARALVGEPQIILADEPTGALDSQTGKDIMQVFLQLHQAGCTILIVTHDTAIASQCTRQIILADGEMVKKGSLSLCHS